MEKVAEAIVENYVDGETAIMGAGTLNSFAAEDIDLIIDAEEVPKSILAAGSKTFLTGALFGAQATLQMVGQADGELEPEDIVRDHSDAIENSLTLGLTNLKADTFDKLRKQTEQ